MNRAWNANQSIHIPTDSHNAPRTRIPQQETSGARHLGGILGFKAQRSGSRIISFDLKMSGLPQAQLEALGQGDCGIHKLALCMGSLARHQTQQPTLAPMKGLRHSQFSMHGSQIPMDSNLGTFCSRVPQTRTTPQQDTPVPAFVHGHAKARKRLILRPRSLHLGSLYPQYLLRSLPSKLRPQACTRRSGLRPTGVYGRRTSPKPGQPSARPIQESPRASCRPRCPHPMTKL